MTGFCYLLFCRSNGGLFTMAAVPAARSCAIGAMSLTGTGWVRGNWTEFSFERRKETFQMRQTEYPGLIAART